MPQKPSFDGSAELAEVTLRMPFAGPIDIQIVRPLVGCSIIFVGTPAGPKKALSERPQQQDAIILLALEPAPTLWYHRVIIVTGNSEGMRVARSIGTP
jgi:hypothetical protein